MSGNKILLDTNIVLYLLSSEYECLWLKEKQVFVSFVTELELLSYPLINKNEERCIEFFLSRVDVLDLSRDIKKQSILLRRKYRLKLPDAIIAATALCEKLTFVSNDKQLWKIEEIGVASMIPDSLQFVEPQSDAVS